MTVVLENEMPNQLKGVQYDVVGARQRVDLCPT